MLRKSFVIAVVAGLASLLTPTDAHAWGARHVGYTHVGPSGVQHYGATQARGPYGAYSGAHVSTGTGAHYNAAVAGGYGGGAHAAGAAASGGYHYNTGAAAGSYHYGTVNTGGYGAAGVYRRY